METRLEIQFDLEPIVPDTSASIKSYFNTALKDAMAESALQEALASEPRIVFEQHLPSVTLEQVEIATATLAFALQEGPTIRQYVKEFLDLLMARLSKKAPTTIDFKWQRGEKELEAKGLSPDDAVKAVIDNYEVIMRPRKKK